MVIESDVMTSQPIATTGAGLAKTSSRRKNILSRELKFRNCMLFPEKMIDFVRTTGPIFLFAVKALHRENI